MTTASATKPVGTSPAKSSDPDSYRMTIGEHLEELRMRVLFALAGFVIATIVCMIFGEHVVRWFLRPLMIALQRNNLPPQVYYTEAAESFMVYIKASLITAATFASPWMLYQLWQFIAAGLYPNERKYITRYLPLSIGLLVTGMVFLYAFVLPLMLEFFLAFNIGIPFDFPPSPIDPHGSQNTVMVPTVRGDPPAPADGMLWFDDIQGRLKIQVHGKVRVLALTNSALATPMITLAAYIDMVVQMLLSFGLAFQLPLVVLALVRIGILDVPTLKRMRRIVYFSMAVIAAFIVPDVVTGMIALVVPLILLFEMGLWMARERPPAQTPTAD